MISWWRSEMFRLGATFEWSPEFIAVEAFEAGSCAIKQSTFPKVNIAPLRRPGPKKATRLFSTLDFSGGKMGCFREPGPYNNTWAVFISSWLVVWFRGLYITQLCGDQKKPIQGSLYTKQYNGMPQNPLFLRMSQKKIPVEKNCGISAHPSTFSAHPSISAGAFPRFFADRGRWWCGRVEGGRWVGGWMMLDVFFFLMFFFFMLPVHPPSPPKKQTRMNFASKKKGSFFPKGKEWVGLF